MKIFYSDIINVSSNTFVLDADESFHAIKVMRLHEGDDIVVLNGKGYRFNATIQKADLKECLINIKSHEFQLKSAPEISIALSLLKKRDRIEWFVEKAVEFAVSELIFYVCEHSEKSKIDMNRIKKIIISAMKQSGNCWMPEVKINIEFDELVAEAFQGQKLIAYCPTGEEKLLTAAYEKAQPVRVLIGPEGDFTQDEISIALRHDFREVSLGKLILRAETAALTALITVKVLNQC